VKAGLTDKVEFVEVTVDPQRDSPSRLLAYQQLYRPAPDWVSLTGTSRQLATFWRFFGVAYQRVPVDDPPPTDWLTGKPSRYDVQHTDALVFLDPQGRERYLVVGIPRTKGANLPPRMRRYLSAEGRTNLAHPGREAWTVAQGLQALGWLLHTDVAG
jgi:protein SCO1/2